MVEKNKKTVKNKSEYTSASGKSSMNDELQQWISESQKEGAVPLPLEKKINEPVKKNVTGKCQICGQKKAKFLCVNCGAPTCTSCYFHLVGLCKNCLEKHKGEKWKGRAPDWEKTLGVEWID